MPDPRDIPTVVARLRAAGCVFAEDEARLLTAAAKTPDQLTAMVDQRVTGIPLEHILGWAEFCGRRIVVEPGVFVPRRRTEILVRQAVSVARSAGPAPTSQPATVRPSQPVTARRCVLVELCCGSGAVSAALLAVLPQAECHVADIDPAAVRCARRNLADVGGHVHQGDLYQPLPATLRGAVDLLVVNAPYVPTAAVGLLPPEARIHEPRIALDGGPDGLDILRRVISEARDWLAPGGHLLVESSRKQAPLLADIASRNRLLPKVVHSPELQATALVARIADDAGRSGRV